MGTPAGQPTRESDGSVRTGAPQRPRVADETLLALLGDESPVVRREVRRELQQRGRGADALLARASRSTDARLRSAARRLALRRDRAKVARRMLKLALKPAISLESGLWLMSRFETPTLDARPYQLALDAFAAEVIARRERKKSDVRPSDALIDYLAGQLRFDGDKANYHHPDNVYLHAAITRRSGMPLTLVAIYLAVARRASIRAAAVHCPATSCCASTKARARCCAIRSTAASA